ncbi:hypothetical protein Bbelb_049480 [Branchiostoma belcheri]|nr:hypothetical protein Bbelb_049480 [Branchiostoma belcheri]
MKAVYKVLEAMENGKMPTEKDVIHDEQRSKKSYGIPVRILPCRVVKDAQLRTLKDDLQRAMEEIGMVVVGFVIDGEWKSLRTIGSHRAKTLKVKDVNITDGDQMPLHRNDTAGQKTLTMKDCPTYVKNYILSRERVTVFTQASSMYGHSHHLTAVMRSAQTNRWREPGTQNGAPPLGPFTIGVEAFTSLYGNRRRNTSNRTACLEVEFPSRDLGGERIQAENMESLSDTFKHGRWRFTEIRLADITKKDGGENILLIETVTMTNIIVNGNFTTGTANKKKLRTNKVAGDVDKCIGKLDENRVQAIIRKAADMATEAAGAKKTAPNGEFGARPDSNAGAVITIDGIVIKGIPPDRRDVVIDAKRGTTVRSIAGKAIGRLPAAWQPDLRGSHTRPGRRRVTGVEVPSSPPASNLQADHTVARQLSSIYIKLDARKDGMVAKLKEAVDRHMAAAGTGGPTVLEEIHDVSGWMDSYLCEYHNHVEPRAFLFKLGTDGHSVAQFYTEYAAPVWRSGLTASQSSRIERIQRRAVRIILGPNYSNYADACSQLGLASLHIIWTAVKREKHAGKYAGRFRLSLFKADKATPPSLAKARTMENFHKEVTLLLNANACDDANGSPIKRSARVHKNADSDITSPDCSPDKRSSSAKTAQQLQEAETPKKTPSRKSNRKGKLVQLEFRQQVNIMRGVLLESNDIADEDEMRNNQMLDRNAKVSELNRFKVHKFVASLSKRCYRQAEIIMDRWEVGDIPGQPSKSRFTITQTIFCGLPGLSEETCYKLLSDLAEGNAAWLEHKARVLKRKPT